MSVANARIALKVLDERVRGHLPAYGSIGAAGMDLRACIDAPITLEPGQVERIPASPRWSFRARASATSTASCSAISSG